MKKYLHRCALFEFVHIAESHALNPTRLLLLRELLLYIPVDEWLYMYFVLILILKQAIYFHL